MSQGTTDSQKERKGHRFRDLKHLRMPLLFFFTVILLNLVSYVTYQKGYLSFIDTFTAQATTGVIHLFGMPAIRENTVIRLTNALWVVNTECTAVTIMIIFSSFIAVYKASFKAKGIGLLFGLSIIFAANITRLLLMAFIDRYKPEFSTLFHDYLWQVAFIIMVVFLWILWLDKVVKRETKTAISG
jgi:archaeosortase B (VPXXXP-CTERM-specific)